MSKIDEKAAKEAWRLGNPSIDELPFPAFLAMLENYEAAKAAEQPVVQLDFILADLPEVLKEPWDKIRPYVNGTPELLSLLYDLDLMPEQIIRKRDFVRMMQLAEWHKNTTFKRESLDPILQESWRFFNAEIDDVPLLRRYMADQRIP